MNRYTVTINIGFLWYSQMRQSLRRYEQEFPNLKWEEGDGWLEHDFYISGPLEIIKRIYSRFKGWSSFPKAVVDRRSIYTLGQGG